MPIRNQERLRKAQIFADASFQNLKMAKEFFNAESYEEVAVFLCLTREQLAGVSPTRAQISEKTDIHASTINRILRNLEKRGIVVREREGRHFLYRYSDKHIEEATILGYNQDRIDGANDMLDRWVHAFLDMAKIPN